MSSQIKNLKPRTNKEKIKHLGVLFFSLFLTLAVFSQIAPKATSDVALGWGNNLQPTTYNLASPAGGLKPSDWLYYKSSNDVTAYLGKKSSNLPTVRYQKNKDYLEFSMTGVSSTTSVSLETDVKTLNTPTLFYRNIFDGADANYQITNLPFKIKEEIVLKHPPAALERSYGGSASGGNNLTFLFSAETSAKPVKQKDGSIAFFDNQNNYLFQLDKPFMIDAKGARSEDVSIEIVPVGKTKLSPRNNTFNFQLPILNFQSRLNDLISKLIPVSLKAFLPLKISNWKFIENWPLKIENSKPQLYQIALKADSEWLNSPDRVYPVVIDPTVTHNADANFTGQMNRIADSDTTSSTQLESSYPEATKDPYTVLLLHFNEANGATAGIRDYASTTRVITANGNASTTNYVTQLGLGNSAAFDGAGDYLTLSDSEDFNIGSSAAPFSIDTWVRFNNVSSEQSIITHVQNGVGQWSFRYSGSTNTLLFNAINSWPTNSINFTAPFSPSIGSFYHIVLVKINNDNTTTAWRIYINGVSQTLTLTDGAWNGVIPNVSANLEIGGISYAGGYYLNGYLDSVRILKGRALTPEEIKAAASRRPYAVYTSSVLDATASVAWNTLNWTEGGVKTGDGETLYNSSGLVAQWNFNETSGTTADNAEGTAALDGTLTNFAYTASQDQATTTTGWTANNKKWGAGALMFDGVNDYVEVADNAGWDFSSSDGSIEFWVYPNSTSVEQLLVGQSNSSSDGNWFIYIRSSGELAVGLAGTNEIASSGYALTTGKWYHVAVVKNGSITTIYKNGISIASNTTGVWNNATTFLRIGGGSATYNRFSGVIDSLRIYKSRALSASEILSNYNAGNIEIQTRTGATSDPNDGSWGEWKPTTGETQLLSMDSDAANWNAPQQIDGYTKLLLHMDGTDTATTFPNSATTTHTVTAVNQAQVDTAQSKFGGGSGLFDGTGDYLTVPDSDDWNFGSGDFTIDGWVRLNSLPGAEERMAVVSQSDANDGWRFNIITSGGAQFIEFLSFENLVTKINISNSVGTIKTNTWYHMVITRMGNTFKTFLDGVQGGSDVVDTDAVANFTSVLQVGTINAGQGFNGWLDEFRISKGIARWTSNFTPPPRPYGSNVKAENETTLKQEGTASAKLTLGAPQVDGNTVALWHFEETGTTTGTTLYDSSANARNLTTTGTLPTDGIFGKARRFNGSSDYATISSSGFPTGSASRTIMAWIKSEDCSNSACFVFGYGVNSAGQVFGAAGYPGGNWRFQGNGTGDLNTGVAFVQNKWHHIAVSYDGTTVRFYLNGIEIANGAKTLNTGGTVFHIGDSESDTTNKWKGIIDEMAILNRVLSPDEIAETYRMGANHHLTRQVSAVDLSSANKLAFNIASDRPGTYLDAMLGESDYANYELASSTLALSTTTVLYIKGDEIASSTSIKDSSFSGKAITANGNARTSGNGKIGNAMYFDGSGDYLTVPDSADWDFGSGDFSVSYWTWRVGSGSDPGPGSLVIGREEGVTYTAWQIGSNNGVNLSSSGSSWIDCPLGYNSAISWQKWHNVVLTRSGTTFTVFVDGVRVASCSSSDSLIDSSNPLSIGKVQSVTYANGYMDEIRILKGAALSADQIRQAYEYGLRSHQITIDFGATLQTSDLISSATDYNFSLTATTSGLSATTSGLYLGDKIIIKENLGGTEYTAQGTVNSINTTTGAITVPLWDSGSSFPSGGFTQYATVFKWQREYFDLTGAATTTRNAITNLTLRPTNGAEGRTIYLDDFRYNTNYLTASSSSAITSSNNRYLQYRAIFSSWDSFVSPYLSAINTLYTSTANMFAPLIGVSGGGFLSF